MDAANSGEGYTDKWVTYGTPMFTSKELTIMPGVKMTLKDNGASGVICMQGRGRIGSLPLECPAMIRYGEMTEDEVFITEKAAREGVVIENLGKECPLVLLRYFGPDVNPQSPAVGAHKKG